MITICSSRPTVRQNKSMSGFSDSDGEFEAALAEGLHKIRQSSEPTGRDHERQRRTVKSGGDTKSSYRCPSNLISSDDDDEYPQSQAVESQVCFTQSQIESEPDGEEIAPRYNDVSTDDDKFNGFLTKLKPASSGRDFIIRSDSEEDVEGTQAADHSMEGFIDDDSILSESDDSAFYLRTNNLLNRSLEVMPPSPRTRKTPRDKTTKKRKPKVPSSPLISPEPMLSYSDDLYGMSQIHKPKIRARRVVESDSEASDSDQVGITSEIRPSANSAHLLPDPTFSPLLSDWSDCEFLEPPVTAVTHKQPVAGIVRDQTPRRGLTIPECRFSPGREKGMSGLLSDSEGGVSGLLSDSDDEQATHKSLTQLRKRTPPVHSILTQPEDLFSDSDSDFENALSQGLKALQERTPARPKPILTPSQKLSQLVKQISQESNEPDQGCTILSDEEGEDDDVIFVGSIDTPVSKRNGPKTHSHSTSSQPSAASSLIRPQSDSWYPNLTHSASQTSVAFTPLKTKNNKRLVQATLTPEAKINKPFTSTPAAKRYPNLERFTRTEPRMPVFLSFLASLSDVCNENKRRDHQAEMYVKEFKKHRLDLTERLRVLYNEKVFDGKLSDTPVTWNKRLLKTAGQCVYTVTRHSKTRSAEVQLSEKVCDTAERLRDTLIHEMCHAAVWIINEQKDGHGRYWQWWSRKSELELKDIPRIRRCHSYDIQTKYTYQCTRCSNRIGRHSKSLDITKKCCGLCRGKFVLLSKDGSSESTSVSTPNKFALYVKENYGSVRKEHKGSSNSHADTMKALGKAFKDVL